MIEFEELDAFSAEAPGSTVEAGADDRNLLHTVIECCQHASIVPEHSYELDSLRTGRGRTFLS